MSDITKNCPICLQNLKFNMSRYPNYICEQCCAKEIRDSNGYLVTFENESLTGGFISLHNINGTIVQKKENICWIDNIKCYANEMRFGGIIIEKIL